MGNSRRTKNPPALAVGSVKVYKCEGGGTVFKVLSEARKTVCTVAVLGSEKNGYNVIIVSPDSEKFVSHQFQTLDQEIPNTAHFPLPPEALKAISCGLYDIKNGFPIGFTSIQQRATEQEQARPTLPIEGKIGGIVYRISDMGDGETRLDIYGGGKIPDADPNHPYPWDEYSDSIDAVWVHYGITEIGKGVFDGFENAEFILPDGIKTADGQTYGDPQPQRE